MGTTRGMAGSTGTLPRLYHWPEAGRSTEIGISGSDANDSGGGSASLAVSGSRRGEPASEWAQPAR